MTRMPPKNGYQPPPEPPEYIRRWVGRRVEWTGERAVSGSFQKVARAGVVINAGPVRLDGHIIYINLHIASDDGFLCYVRDQDITADYATTTSEKNQ